MKLVNKSLLPFMHKKTYFQSLKSIFSESPNGFLKSIKNNEKYEKDNVIGKLDEYVLYLTIYSNKIRWSLIAKNRRKTADSI
jgi:hypothetical protein